MTTRHHHVNDFASSAAAALPAGFVAVCVLSFAAGTASTVYFCRTMGGGMRMPGGWTMSMMWMRMAGQTWITSAASFLLMWLAMMVAMMLPCALPTFLRTRRGSGSLFCMAAGYFAIWLAAGAGIYVLGVALAAVAMRSEALSRAVPALFGASLIAAGAIQLTGWKVRQLSCCRSVFGCALPCPQDQGSFRLGCGQGMACCVCCSAPMMILLILGMMDSRVLIAVTAMIAAERLFPRPVIAARLIGVLAIVAGVVYLFMVYVR